MMKVRDIELERR